MNPRPWRTYLLRILRREEAAAATEYAVMLALIVAVCASVIGSLGLKVQVVCDAVCTVLGR
jgi:Flp pilus assembly pilin Flp